MFYWRNKFLLFFFKNGHFWFLQGENESNSGGFDGDTVTVMQQPITSSVPAQRGAEDFVGGGMDVFGRQIGSPNLGAPKKRGRPPGSNWLRQQRDFMALQGKKRAIAELFDWI